MPVSGVWMTSLALLEQSNGSQLCSRELLCSRLQLLAWHWHTDQRTFDSCHVGAGCQFGTSAALLLLWDIGIKPVANILGFVLPLSNLQLLLQAVNTQFMQVWWRLSRALQLNSLNSLTIVPCIQETPVRAVRRPPESSFSHNLKTPSATVRR